MAIDWSTVAPSWEDHADDVEQAKAQVTKLLLERLAIAEGDRVLELGAGPGSLGRRLAALVGDTGRVHLTDIATGMVEVARRRTEGIGTITVDVADATDTGLPDAAYDVVLFRMGLMLVEQPTAALAEARRVLAPGGRFGAAVWAAPEHNPWLTAAGIAAAMHGVTSGGPPVGPGGVFSLGDPDALAALLAGAGLTAVEVVEVDASFRYADADDHFGAVGTMAPPLAEALAAASPEARDAVRRTAADLVAPYAVEDGSLLVPGRALVATARG